MKTCPYCEQSRITSVGPADSTILVVIFQPSKNDLELGYPLSGNEGRILWDEMGSVGLDLRRMKIASIWNHEPHGKKHEHVEHCYNFGLSKVIKLASKRRAVLLLGSDATKAIVNRSIMEVTGLRIENECSLFKVECMVAALSPDTIMYRGLGEFKLAIRKFAEYTEAYNE